MSAPRWRIERIIRTGVCRSVPPGTFLSTGRAASQQQQRSPAVSDRRRIGARTTTTTAAADAGTRRYTNTPEFRSSVFVCFYIRRLFAHVFLYVILNKNVCPRAATAAAAVVATTSTPSLTVSHTRRQAVHDYSVRRSDGPVT